MRELVKLNKTSDIMRVVLSIFADATRAFARGESIIKVEDSEHAWMQLALMREVREPTEEELAEFNKWWNEWNEV